MSASPRKVVRLARDKFNHPLWTGRQRSRDDEEANRRLAKFRESYAGGLGGAEGMRNLVESIQRRKGAEEVEQIGDVAIQNQDAMFELLESEDAYAPTRGRDPTRAPKKKKGVRTKE
jgi:hypothetical protein